MLNKALIIDDSFLVHHIYQLLLSRYQCRVVTAMNGKDGLAALAEHSDIDLVLVDINMPVMNGLDFIRNVKQQGRYEHIPIIIVSTEDENDDTKRAVKLGAHGYVMKPIHPGRLHALIEKVTAVAGESTATV